MPKLAALKQRHRTSPGKPSSLGGAEGIGRAILETMRHNYVPTGTETPANKIATAQAILSLVFRLNYEVNVGRITADIFANDVDIFTGATGLRLPAAPELTIVDLEAGMQNLNILALSASALALDEALDEVFGKLNEDKDTSRHALRVMVNQFRNAFAHNPWRAKWLVYPKYRNRYPIILDEGSAFTFDATNLDGQGIKPEQVGGLEFWIKVLQHCEKLVARVSGQ